MYPKFGNQPTIAFILMVKPPVHKQGPRRSRCGSRPVEGANLLLISQLFISLSLL